MPAFLNVEQSLTGRRWIGPEAEVERRAEGLAQAATLPLPVARVLAERGIAASDVPGFLQPKLRDLLPDPRRLKDMEAACARLLAAARAGERIAIFADYDVDGGASAALLLDWLGAQGRKATLYIPDRIDEGYGPNPPAMAALAAAHDLIVCVDCGTMSHEALAAAAGTDVIVLDHHLGGQTLPPALAVVNPNRQDESGAFSHLCAAGVVFLALVEANRQAREAGHGPMPDLLPMLDLVALATVADVAPLVGVNRAFVRQGLAIMARRARPGVAALADVARLDCAPAVFHLGHLIGPRINAGGRVGRADLGARCLAAAGAAEAEALAAQLDALNHERRAVEAAVREAALAQAEARASAPVAWAAGDGWHPGVVGIVASRLKDATGRPAVVIGLDGGIGKGSARSVPGVDLGRAVHRLAEEGLLLKGGGHAMAAGLTVAEDRIEAAMARLAELLAADLAAAPGRGTLRISGLLAAGGATPALCEMLESAGPYGAAAPAPRFALPDLRLERATTMGDGQHLRLSLRPAAGPSLEAVAWGAMAGPLGPALLAAQGTRLHAAGKLELSRWQGRQRLRLRLDDAARA